MVDNLWTGHMRIFLKFILVDNPQVIPRFQDGYQHTYERL